MINTIAIHFKLKRKAIVLLLLLSNQFGFSQEWKNLREYQKSKGENELRDGCWLRKDRKRNTATWKQANVFNLSIENGNQKYITILEKRDFYLWFDEEREKQGHEINIIGVVAIVADQLSNFDKFFIKTFVIRNKEVVWFGHEGSDRVLEYAFPLLKEVYFSKEPLKDQAAKDWDLEFEKTEQCKIVEAVYKQLPDKAIGILERMAKGKGIYNLAVKKELKFTGEITNCKDRYEFAFSKLLNYYLENK